MVIRRIIIVTFHSCDAVLGDKSGDKENFEQNHAHTRPDLRGLTKNTCVHDRSRCYNDPA